MVLKEVYRENFENGAGVLNAGLTWQIRPSDKDVQEHAPFNIIWVFNDSDEKLQVKFDGDADNYIVVDPKTTAGINLEDGIAFNTVDVTNLSGTDAAANEVRIRVARIKDVTGGTV